MLWGPCVLCLQDDYYKENAKLLAEASKQMQPEVRNWFPTVANVGASPMAHHHHHHSGEDGGAKASVLGEEAGGVQGGGTSTGAAGEESGAAGEGKEEKDRASSSSCGSGRKNRKGQLSSSGPAAAAAGDGDGAESIAGSNADGNGGLKMGKASRGKTVGEGLVSKGSEHGNKLTESLAAAASETLKKATPSPEQQIFIVRWAQKAMGGLAGLGTAAFLIFYQWVIEPAPPNSLRTRAFAKACKVGVGDGGGGVRLMSCST